MHDNWLTPLIFPFFSFLLVHDPVDYICLASIAIVFAVLAYCFLLFITRWEQYTLWYMNRTQEALMFMA